MNLVVYAAPASEPLSVSEVMTHCRIDASNQEPAPGLVTAALASPAAAGNVDNGVHRWLAVFVTSAGKTQAGTASAPVTVANKTVNGQVSLTGIPIGGPLVTAREIYRTQAGGSTYLLVGTISDNTTTTYTDNVADSALGAQAPTVNTTSDPQLSLLIASVRAAAELYLRRKLITQTLDLYLDEFPCEAPWEIRLPPLQSVASITYVDTSGAEQTLDAADYLVDAVSQPARIAPAYSSSWPSTRRQHNAVKVRFVAGYGAASAVPSCIKNWMLLRIKALYDNPADIVVGTSGMVRLPADFTDCLLDPERISARI